MKNSAPVVYNGKQKLAIYFSTCISLLIMATIIVSVWLVFGRPLTALGLRLRIDGTRWIWTTIAFIILYAIDTIYSVASPKNIADSISDWQKRTPFMPTVKNELPGYVLMCLCAGVFEEIVYRGYLVTYFENLFSASHYQQILAVLVPSLVFAVSHYYHGTKNMIKIFVLSAFLGFIFIQSGSLVVVMILHFVTNVIGGLLSVKYLAGKVKIQK